MPKAKRAANGAGSIRKVVKNGREYWEARYFDPVQYKQRSISAKTQAEVVKKLHAVQGGMDTGGVTSPSKLLVISWFRTWLNEYKPDIKDGTRYNYASAIENHWASAFGQLLLSDVTPAQYQKCLNAIAASGIKAKTVKNLHGIAHEAFDRAVMLGMIPRNPASRAELPRRERVEIRPLSGEEIQTFLSALHGHKYETLLYSAIYTGCRISELLGLQWEDIDFNTGRIVVSKQLAAARGRDNPRKLTETKTGNTRTIIAPRAVIEALKEHKQRQENEAVRTNGLYQNPNNFVFTRDTGEEIPLSSVEHAFIRLRSQIGLHKLRIHDLRHTYATEALRLGVDPLTVSRNLGHSTPAFTLSVYGHVTNEMQEKAAEKFQNEIERRGE